MSEYNAVLETIVQRRSVRHFTSEQISDEQLQTILNAGLYAPNAGGVQSCVFVVCQDAELNKELGVINVEVLRSLVAKGRHRRTEPGKPSLPEQSAQRNSGFYDAPTVITIFAPNSYNQTMDCAVAAQNMLLAAHSVGVAGCIAARAAETFATERGQEIQTMWGIKKGLEAKLHVLLGYSSEPLPEPKPRKIDRVIWVRQGAK